MKPDKNTIVIPIKKPRNPNYELLASKHGGLHKKSEKSIRSKNKRQLQQNLRASDDFRGSFHLVLAYEFKR